MSHLKYLPSGYKSGCYVVGILVYQLGIRYCLVSAIVSCFTVMPYLFPKTAIKSNICLISGVTLKPSLARSDGSLA